MASKPLSVSLAERLSALSSRVPHHVDAFVNHLGILLQARIEDGHEELEAAVKAASTELEMDENFLVGQVLKHIASEKTASAERASGTLAGFPRAATG